ncbi:haloacid dehalogenase-like hydrolase [Bradyrhizobium canariense]|nr:haloacid dehalogenase-like hydrolase [Bradyrhizobium canariense]
MSHSSPDAHEKAFSHVISFGKDEMESALDCLTTTIQALPSDSLIVVDFDETLWLRNSTEEYLNSLRPRWAAILVLAAIDLVGRWIWFGNHVSRHVYRDWCRVLLTTLFLPWSLPLWRWRAPRLASQWRNNELLRILSARPELPIHVATFGFNIVVGPLVRHIVPTARMSCAASLLFGYKIRKKGKRAHLEALLGLNDLTKAAVISDSEDDADLLEVCKNAFLIRWAKSQFKPAFSESYRPFYYTQRVKRPGGNYMCYGVLFEDVAFLWIALAWTMPFPVVGMLALLVVHLSFWVIYELGYFENDTAAAKREKAPNVPSGTAEAVRRMKSGPAWIVALLLGIAGGAILTRYNAQSVHGLQGLEWAQAFVGFCGIWLLYLIASRIAFWVYNRTNTELRAYVYVILQVFRSIGYTIIIDCNSVGGALLLALVFARWQPYLTYRFAGVYRPVSYRLLTAFYLIVLALSSAMVSLTSFFFVQFFVALSWSLLLAQTQLRELITRSSVSDKA